MEYNFIPADITLGRFDNNNAFVTCKYKYDKWKNISIFERLCKYKPHTQRSSETELMKAISNSVDTISNEPATGFKFVAHSVDTYGMYYHADQHTDVILQDPRGFNVTITADNFYYMLKCCNYNMNNGILEHKFAYVWNEQNRFMLADAETDEFKKIKKQSDKLKEQIDTTQFLSKRNLVVGKIYRCAPTSKCTGRYMYMGEHNVYDIPYHNVALQKYHEYSYNKYSENTTFYDDIQEYSKEYSAERTGLNRMVFFNIDGKSNDDIFMFKTSISKLFVGEESDIDLTKCKLKVADGCATYENVKNYMSTCLMFNKIDFKSFSLGKKERMPIDDFFNIYKISNDNHWYNSTDNILKAYPIYISDIFVRNIFIVGEKTPSPYKGQYIRIHFDDYSNSKYNITVERYSSDPYIWNSHRQILSNGVSVTLEYIYKYVDPYLFTAKFENGKDIPCQYMIYISKYHHSIPNC